MRVTEKMSEHEETAVETSQNEIQRKKRLKRGRKRQRKDE